MEIHSSEYHSKHDGKRQYTPSFQKKKFPSQTAFTADCLIKMQSYSHVNKLMKDLIKCISLDVCDSWDSYYDNNLWWL